MTYKLQEEVYRSMPDIFREPYFFIEKHATYWLNTWKLESKRLPQKSYSFKGLLDIQVPSDVLFVLSIEGVKVVFLKMLSKC